MNPPVEAPHAAEAARLRARHQLRQVLSLLALLDAGVLIIVVGLAVAGAEFRWPAPELLGVLLLGVGAILSARVMIAVRLYHRSGNLL
ncbi:MAG: hypothetical protein L3K14_02410 [Thermoplasmata archaeon]|nr:hypothetical protein [Thermoplasmata archaeon]